MARNPKPSPRQNDARRASPVGLRLALGVLAPILFFCGLEGVLRLAGVGKPTALFIPDETPGFVRTNPNFTSPFIPASFGIQPLNFRFKARKDANTLRIFVLGESAAQGMPDPDFGFAAQLGAQLKARYPAKSFEILNLGITAINSNVVYQAAREAVSFEPDLLVVYMGNNEVIGPYGPGCAYLSATPSLGIIRASVAIRSTRTGQALERLLHWLMRARARTGDWKGMETFSNSSVAAGDPRMERVYRNFSENLKDIVGCAQKAGIKTVLATVVANLKENAPFISLHRAGMSPGELTAWSTAYSAGKIAADLGDARSAALEFEEAAKIDPEYAETFFRLGALHAELGNAAQAREDYQRALHWDALHFRPDSRVNALVRQVSRDAGRAALLVDSAVALGSDPGSSASPPGREILFDHVHFNWAGNFRMGQLIAEGCARQLFGAGGGAGAGLDSAACAEALGYTPEAELKMLQTLVQLTVRPPFTAQYTFSESQAELKEEIGRVIALRTPEERKAERTAVERACRRDPESAALAVRLASMESEAGNPGAALALLDKAAALEPASADLSRRRAQVLFQLQRYDESEALLLESVGLDEDYFVAAGALVDVWSATGQSERGKQYFTEALKRSPSNPYLRLEYAQLLSRSGDLAGSEREARRIWDEDPSGRPAMAAVELLVRLYGQQGQLAKADTLTQESAIPQRDDYFNNHRLVQIYAVRNEPAKVVQSLQALESSGPFDSAQHLDLAHRLADLNRIPEMLDELSLARSIAVIEGNEPQARAVGERIETYRQRFADKQPR